MELSILLYAIALVLIVILIFISWQLWCVFALNIANPVLRGLHAPIVSTRMCGGTVNALQQASNWAKGLKPPEIPAIDISIPPVLLVQVGIGLGLLATFVFLAVVLNQLLKSIKDDLSKLWESFLGFWDNFTRSILEAAGLAKLYEMVFKKKKPKRSARKRVSMQIFVSYRRLDSSDVTGRIYDRLIKKFGREAVFKDVDSIPLGVDFKEYIGKKVGECQVLLSVIGDHWLDVTDASGKRRLDDPADFVRLELEAALQRDIPVIPLFVGGVKIPQAVSLPSSLEKLVLRNGILIRADPDFHRDMSKLIKELEHYVS